MCVQACVYVFAFPVTLRDARSHESFPLNGKLYFLPKVKSTYCVFCRAESCSTARFISAPTASTTNTVMELGCTMKRPLGLSPSSSWRASDAPSPAGGFTSSQRAIAFLLTTLTQQLQEMLPALQNGFLLPCTKRLGSRRSSPTRPRSPLHVA